MRECMRKRMEDAKYLWSAGQKGGASSLLCNLRALLLIAAGAGILAGCDKSGRPADRPSPPGPAQPPATAPAGESKAAVPPKPPQRAEEKKTYGSAFLDASFEPGKEIRDAVKFRFKCQVAENTCNRNAGD